MALKHLKQLLDEDQEPFVLKNYIDERRCQLKRPVSKTQLQVKRRKPISENSSFFCKNACFFSFHDSPDVKMSPLFSPVKSPCRNSNTLFVHIPSKTAAILLEAALRIQKHSAAKKQKNPKNIGFGFFGSMLKRITSQRNKKRNNNISVGDNEIKVSVKDILRWDSSNGRKRVAEKEESKMDFDEIRVSEVGFSCSCNSRVSSAWSESNEEKSMDLETSSSRSEDSDEMDFVDEQMMKPGDFSSYEKEFCSSPFRFVLQNCSSPTGEITPEFMSPVTSPSRLKKQVVKNEEGQLNCVGKELEEEEKEQFSPVSVLDPQFEEDDDEDDGQEDDGEEKDGFELERSFASVQRARQQLLHKLRRFERLADLNPIELEKRIAEEEEELEDDDEELYDDDEDEDEDEVISDSYKGDSFIREVLSLSNLCNVDERIPSDMKRLILDLMAKEEEQEECGSSSHDREEMMMKKLRKRLDSWTKVESDTIDMMVELDFRSEGDLWRKNQEQVRETAVAIEFDIFTYLVKELSEELVHSSPLY